nr:phytanoyl-CoA dioxygenase family protein [Paraglaciecola sp. G1-23]
MQYLFTNAPQFDVFESWIIKTCGRPGPLIVNRLNALVAATEYPNNVKQWLSDIESTDSVFSKEDLLHWNKYGYVVLHDAISESACLESEKAIWDFIGANPQDKATWYNTNAHGIMVELIQHPVLDKNRQSLRIHKAFSQLWETTDLWVTADRCGFHPPQSESYPFPGPDLHWDLDFNEPLGFGTQGILYLTDTHAEQGALTLVPGFHHCLNDWLNTLDAKQDPQKQDLHKLGSVPVAGKAGDLIIWHSFLPHGSRPNLANKPRIVQYLNMLPSIENMSG